MVEIRSLRVWFGRSVFPVSVSWFRVFCFEDGSWERLLFYLGGYTRVSGRIFSVEKFEFIWFRQWRLDSKRGRLVVAQGGCEEEEVKSKVVAYSFMSEISCFYLGSVWLLGEYSLRSRQIRSSFRSVSPPGVVEWGGGCATCVGSWNSYTSVSSECWSSMCWSYSHLFLPTVRIDLSVLNLWRVLMRCKCLWDCRIMRMLRSFAIRNWCIWHDRWWKNIVFKEFLWRKVVCCIDIIWVFWRRLIFDFDK